MWFAMRLFAVIEEAILFTALYVAIQQCPLKARRTVSLLLIAIAHASVFSRLSLATATAAQSNGSRQPLRQNIYFHLQ